MHVESVAWIAERKDVLSTFFWLLTVGAYFRYVRAPSVPRFVLTMVFLGAGLMAKPMLVTLPLVLVLLDFWPLGRLSLFGPRVSRVAPAIEKPREPRPRRGGFTLRQSLVEKLPMFALVLVFIAVTIATQQQIGAVSDVTSRPLGLRIANALVAYSVYFIKLFVPVNLAVFYPYPTRVPVAAALGAAVLLLGITGAAWAVRRQAPYALTGWLWFVGTLVPVIGIVQVGSQAMADRYTYVPHIGLSIALAWGAADLMRRWRIPAPAGFGFAAAILCVLSWLTWKQLEFWKDATHLFRRAIAVTDGNFIAHNNYAAEMLDQKQVDEAITHFERAVAINPTYQAAVYNLGLAYQMKGRYDDSRATLERALALNPQDGRAEYRLAVTLALQQKYPDALPHYQAAVRLAPEVPEIRESYSNALNNYGSALGGGGEYREALKMFEQALTLKPDNESARQNLTYTRQAMAAAGSSR
jgi:tetratricopeptide (TPR) repeat protein